MDCLYYDHDSNFAKCFKSYGISGIKFKYHSVFVYICVFGIVLGEKVFVINVLLWLKIKLLTNKFNALK